ncbi:MAG: GGDEF domain-containing protein [Lachnospiraceae bacterium]|nr:GGDEF domain-containing protein [Lachnospiraceae bacterium]
MNNGKNMSKRPHIGLMVGNYHSDHPRRLVREIWTLLSDKEVDVKFYLGTESSSFLTDFVARGNRFDYQYSFLYDLSHFDDLDILMVSIGTLSIYQSSISVEDFLNRMPDIPIVQLENDIQVKNGIWLITDNYEGMSSCVEHLITEHGLRKLVFIAGPYGNCDSEERLQGYLDTMKKHGLAVEDKMVEHGDYSEHVDELVERLLDNNPDAEAVVSANDEMAVAIYRVCEKRGLKVGRDIAVTGFDDSELSRYMDPPLTTVKQDYTLFAKKAVEKTFEMIETGQAVSERLPSPLIRRTSCGCTKKAVGALDDDDKNELIKNMWSSVDFQHQSWIGALLMREMLLESGDRYGFLNGLGKVLSYLKVSKSYVYLFQEPRKVAPGELPQKPAKMKLALVQNGENLTTFDWEEAPILSAEKGSGIPEQIPDGKYMSFMLFFEEYQYGTLNLEIEPERIEFFYMFALELGSSLRYLQMSMEQARYQAELQALARHDNLTGLYNRLGLIGAVTGYVRNYPKKTLAAMMADLDHLKQINDTFGHKEGDSAISKAADILREAAGPRSPLGRTGGDEYMGVFVADPEERIAAVKQRVKDRCEEYNRISGKPYYLEISLGFHTFKGEEYTELSAVMEKADERLYEAKKSRRASVIKEQGN